MKQTFKSNGKLLLTGEYSVLDGSLALALPTKKGQSLSVERSTDQNIQWSSYDYDQKEWFKTTITVEEIITYDTNQTTENVREQLIKILHIAQELNPNVLQPRLNIQTELDFPRVWGLGTSSTLINNIALWFDIDPYILLQRSFGGSGYDIACASAQRPITYHLKDKTAIVSEVNFNPDFKDQLYFIYLNNKQNSRNAIQNYRNEQHDIRSTVETISELTKSIIQTSNSNEFCRLLQEHETFMSKVLNQQTIKQERFSSYPYTIKSLGAWGGDFILVVAPEPKNLEYFKNKGYNTIIPYQEIVL